jgi:hypothetical protein
MPAVAAAAASVRRIGVASFQNDMTTPFGLRARHEAQRN